MTIQFIDNTFKHHYRVLNMNIEFIYKTFKHNNDLYM